MQGFFDKLYGDRRLAISFFAVLSAFFYIGLGAVHLFDWDEINFAESAREMIASKDYLRVQINFTAFWEKPPFFFWLQVLAMEVFGITEYAARFPNAVFGFIYLVTLYFIGKKHFSARFGMLWALVFFGTLLPHIYFKSGIIDPVFNYFIFLSIYFLLRVIGNDENSGKLALLSGVFSGLSMLTKGPVGFLLLGATLFIYLLIKRFKPFPKFKYILLFFTGFLIIAFIWIAAEIAQNGTETIQKFVAYQLELFHSDVAGHAQPFYYHFFVIALGCFPISLLALPSFRRKESTEFDFQTWMLCLFWVVLIVFSITTTKIIHYSSMTYIPLAFLAAFTLYRSSELGQSVRRWLSTSVFIHGLLIGIAFLSIPMILMHPEWIIPMMNDPFAVASMKVPLDMSGLEFSAGAIFLMLLVLSFYYLRKGQNMAFVLSNALGLGLSLLLVLLLIIPKVERFTQGPSIEFYTSLQNKDCYVESFGYKSYAQYYYVQSPENKREEAKDMTWLLTGEIDKPVYLISKCTNIELDTYPGFRFIREKGGFRMYVRYPQK